MSRKAFVSTVPGGAPSKVQGSRTPLTMLLHTLDNCRASSGSGSPDKRSAREGGDGRVGRCVVSKAVEHQMPAEKFVPDDHDDKENLRGIAAVRERLPKGKHHNVAVSAWQQQLAGILCTVQEASVKTRRCGDDTSGAKMLRLSDTREPGREGEKWGRHGGGGGGGGGEGEDGGGERRRHGVGRPPPGDGLGRVRTHQQEVEMVQRTGADTGGTGTTSYGTGLDAKVANVRGANVHESLRAAEHALLTLLASP